MSTSKLLVIAGFLTLGGLGGSTASEEVQNNQISEEKLTACNDSILKYLELRESSLVRYRLGLGNNEHTRTYVLKCDSTIKEYQKRIGK